MRVTVCSSYSVTASLWQVCDAQAKACGGLMDAPAVQSFSEVVSNVLSAQLDDQGSAWATGVGGALASGTVTPLALATPGPVTPMPVGSLGGASPSAAQLVAAGQRRTSSAMASVSSAGGVVHTNPLLALGVYSSRGSFSGASNSRGSTHSQGQSQA
jgi:hypothetical protein